MQHTIPQTTKGHLSTFPFVNEAVYKTNKSRLTMAIDEGTDGKRKWKKIKETP